MEIDGDRLLPGHVFAFLRESIPKIWLFWCSVPIPFKILIILVSISACVNIIASLSKSIVSNSSSWKKAPDSELMLSFVSGSGQYQRRRIYRDAHAYLFDRKSSKYSFAWLSYWLGNYENPSKVITFLLSLVYLVLAIVGIIEMAIRCFFGSLVYFIVNLSYFVFLLITWVVFQIIIPIFYIADKKTLKTQYCPKCYSAFLLAKFSCPYCGKIHSKLHPGKNGLLYAKCICGGKLPCASITKRKYLKSYCPNCDNILAGPNINSLTIQVIGGNSSGKTAFIAAFQHQYIGVNNKAGFRSVSFFPEYSFKELERIYSSGKTEKSPTDEVRAYFIIHGNKGSSDDGLVFYDVPDEIIISDQYAKNPLNFAYCDGIVIIVDPLSLLSVKSECEAATGLESTIGFSSDSAEDIIVHFINKYSEVAGRVAKKMSDTPVAVLISKTDLITINKQIGKEAIQACFSEKANEYYGYEDARDKICRQYLLNIGLINVINNLESVFSMVSYFPVSSIGHSEDGNPFDPKNVISPINWLARQCHSNIRDYTAFVEEKVNVFN